MSVLPLSRAPQVESVSEPGADQAAAKMWAVYVSEAEKYDRSLVESWKSDMEGMLIFAGLFSASLTAFIIESYRTLRVDSGDATVELLAYISRQLANETSVAAPIVEYSPPRAAILCNTLWFISLGLSLSCALIATLLEQWARDFLHRADMRSSPIIRARIYSFLYYGLKRFKMHTIVDVIPLLLHASLLLFFAGLFAFLYPINPGIAAVSAAILAVVAGVYAALTVLPLVQLDCPYRTPLSSACWRVSLWFSRFAHPKSGHKDTLLEAMSSAAMDPTAVQAERDEKALIWTLKSLADDTELEPFIESIPDVLWGQYARREGTTYIDVMQHLLRNPELQLVSRIKEHRSSCYSGLLLLDASRRRRIACAKALWALGSLPLLDHEKSTLLAAQWSEVAHGFGQNVDLIDAEPDVQRCTVSADAMLRFAAYRQLKPLIPSLLAEIRKQCRLGIMPDLMMTSLESCLINAWGFPRTLWNHEWIYIAASDDTPETFYQKFAQRMVEWERLTPYAIILRFICHASALDKAPHRWIETLETILPEIMLSSWLQPEFGGQWDDILAQYLPALIDQTLSEIIGVPPLVNPQATDPGPEETWNDQLVVFTISFWKQTSPTALPSSLIRYFATRTDQASPVRFKADPRRLWLHLAPTIASSRSRIQPPLSIGPYPTFDDVSRLIWRLTIDQFPVVYVSADMCQHLLKVLHSDPSPQGVCDPTDFSITALLRSLIVYLNSQKAAGELRHPPLDHWHKNANVDSTQRDTNLRRCYQEYSKANITILCEFLERVADDEEMQPYQAAQTLSALSSLDCPPYEAVPKALQRRLAQSLASCVFAVGDSDVAFLEAALSSRIFDMYRKTATAKYDEHPVPPIGDWLDDPVGRTRMVDALQGLSALRLKEDSMSQVEWMLTRLQM
ncbi:hypothetical protein MKEN_00920400 [Mycena kentingensis (nom. inval.)]|nr:hypothetical protein MKEN_00920400 [Mycena kentingensis (nom. inval.)]